MNKLCEVIDKSRIIDLRKSIEKRLKEFAHFEKYLMKLKFLFPHVCKILAGKNENCYRLSASSFMYRMSFLQVNII